ncbi:MAG: hypothetical protein JNN12_13270 [Bacteroidetes Order II. Incertae sedis bacterium]|nr:hypothetical protein [Bacteroidetes Order II. bacterium]
MKKTILPFVLLLLPMVTLAQPITSTYTLTSGKTCKAIPQEDEQSAVWVCPGAGGIKVEFAEGDIRQNATLIFPNKQQADLSLWSIRSGFSSIGDKMEWRMKKVNGKSTPIAFIIRYKVSDDPEDSSKITSYLMVGKIAGSNSCVTDIVKPQANQNVKARTFADNAANQPCLTEQEQ